MYNYFHSNIPKNVVVENIIGIQTIVFQIELIVLDFKMEDDLPAAVDIVMKFATYEEFLDSQVTRLDLSYLEV